MERAFGATDPLDKTEKDLDGPMKLNIIITPVKAAVNGVTHSMIGMGADSLSPYTIDGTVHAGGGWTFTVYGIGVN